MQIRTALLTAGLLAATLNAAQAQGVYVPNRVDQNVSVLDALTLAPAALIPLVAPLSPTCLEGGLPIDVQFTLDGKLAFVSLDECDRVAVIDTATQTVVNLIPTTVSGSFDTRITRRPAGDRMYVTTCTAPIVMVIDVATQTEIATIAIPDGEGLWA